MKLKIRNKINYMARNTKIALFISIVYFALVGILFFIFKNNIGVFSSYILGCVYSLYCVFLINLIESKRSTESNVKALIALPFIWVFLLYVSLNWLSLFLGTTQRVVFFATFVGTMLFSYTIFEKRYTALRKCINAFVLSVIATAISAFLNIDQSLTGSMSTEPSKDTYIIICIIALVWQIITTIQIHVEFRKQTEVRIL